MFDTRSQGGGVLPNGCLVQPGGEVWLPIGHSLPPELLRSGQRVLLPPSAFQRGAALPQNTVFLQAIQTSPHAMLGQGINSSSQLEIGMNQNEFALPTIQGQMNKPLDVPFNLECPTQQPLDVPIPVQCPMQQPLDVPIPVQCPMQQPMDVPIPVQWPNQQPMDVPIPVQWPTQQPMDIPINAQCPMKQWDIPIPVVQCPMKQPLDIPCLKPVDLSYQMVQNPGQYLPKRHVQAAVPSPSKYPPQQFLDLKRSLQHELPGPSKASKKSYKRKPAKRTLQIPKVVPAASEQFACVDLNWGEMDHILGSAYITCPTPASDNLTAVFDLPDLVNMLSETRDNKLQSGVEGLTDGGLSAILTTGVPSPAFAPAAATAVDNAQMSNTTCQPKRRQKPNKRRAPTARVKPQPKKRKIVSDDLKSSSLKISLSSPECLITHVDKSDDIEQPHPKQRKLESDDLKSPSLSISPECFITQVDKADYIEQPQSKKVKFDSDYLHSSSLSISQSSPECFITQVGDIEPVQVQIDHEVKVIRNRQLTEEVKESWDEDVMDTRDDDGHLTFKIPNALRRLFC